jgi:hypothetical protein
LTSIPFDPVHREELSTTFGRFPVALELAGGTGGIVNNLKELTYVFKTSSIDCLIILCEYFLRWGRIDGPRIGTGSGENHSRNRW